jgi:hypothetical protein
VKYELIVTDDDDLIAEISIGRFSRTTFRAISIAGGQLDRVQAAVQRVIPEAALGNRKWTS